MIKLIEVSKEELLEKFKEGKISGEYLIDYIVMVNSTYNEIVDKYNELENKLNILTELKGEE